MYRPTPVLTSEFADSAPAIRALERRFDFDRCGIETEQQHRGPAPVGSGIPTPQNRGAREFEIARANLLAFPELALPNRLLSGAPSTVFSISLILGPIVAIALRTALAVTARFHYKSL